MRVFAFIFILCAAAAAVGYGFDRHEGDVEKGEELARFSGGFVYFTQTVGYRPDLSGLSPGFRVTAEAAFPYDSLLRVVYTRWSSEKSVRYVVPIFNVEREIKTDNLLSDLDVLLEKNFRFGKRGVLVPFVGFERYIESSRVTVNEAVAVSNAFIAHGVLGGFRGEYLLFKSVSTFLSSSVSCLETGYQRHFDMDLHFREKGMLPRAKVALGSSVSFPVGRSMKTLRIEGGYETQFRWYKDLNGAIDWNNPLALQGFSGAILLNF
ncbi:MAG: hypothetical protein KDK76_02680 [Chlamydiia bacterium]|nr:hypothetical protein [Chlamydiia bacterium]